MFNAQSVRLGLAAVALSSTLACGAQDSAVCNQYVACTAAVAPGTLATTLSVYGRDGSCWKSLSPATCEQICKDGLETFRKLPTVPSACQTMTGPDSNPPQGMTHSMDSTAPHFAWAFPTKTQYYSGPLDEQPLGEVDPVTREWGCLRDDKNPSPRSEITRMFEPNDAPDQYVALPNPLPEDLPPTQPGSVYEICPDRSEPKRPDYDAYRFKLQAPIRVVAEARYTVENGDLDLAIFRVDVNPDTGERVSTSIAADMTATSNACVEAHLSPGTYYAVVRGAEQPDRTAKYRTAMNRYMLRVFRATVPGIGCGRGA